jgi:hypothetical protein
MKMKAGDEMLQNQFPPFDESNMSIPHARRIVREHISNLAAAGRLQDAALNQKAVITHLAISQLSQYVIIGAVKTSMIERWVMEAISSQAQRGQQEGAF